MCPLFSSRRDEVSATTLVLSMCKTERCSCVLQYLKRGIAGALEEGYSKPDLCVLGLHLAGLCVPRCWGGGDMQVFWGAEVSWAVLGEELQCPRGGEAVCGNGLGVASLEMEVSQS